MATTPPEPSSPAPGPYRTPAGPTPPPDRRVPPIVIIAGVLIVVGVGLALMPGAPRRSASLSDVPWAVLEGGSQFPPPEPDLPPATPLAPLLVADAPEDLAILAPREGATRVSRGETLWVRFNRPMVRGSEVGRPLARPPITFEPAVPGAWSWSTRSSLLFTPSARAFDRNVEASLVVGEELASLDGEALYDDTPRVVVFDGSPRLLTHEATVAEGAPLSMTFDAPVSPAELAREIFAWEVQGRRPVPVRVSTTTIDGSDDAPARFRVDLALGRPLEAGARVAVALAPRWDRYGGSFPRVVQFSLAPRPRFTGIACEESRWGSARCTFAGDPGQIVDVGPALRLLASERLGAVSEGDVRVTPGLPGLEVRLEGQGAEQGRVVAISGEWAPDQVYEVRLGALRTERGDRVVPLAPLAVRSAGHAPEVQAPVGPLAYEEGAAITLRARGIHVDAGRAIVRPVPEGREVEALMAPASFAAQEQPITVPLASLLPDARPNRWGRGALDAGALTGGARMMVVAFQPGPRATASDLRASFVQQTDLGVTAEALDRGVLVWVSSIARATAVEGAQVELRTTAGEVLARANTDTMGAAWLRSDGRRGATLEWSALSQTTAIVVRSGGDRAVLALDPRRAVGPGALGVSQQGAAPDEEVDAPVRATVIADRGAYRPGERMQVLAIARRVQGASATLPRDQAVRFRLMSAGGETPIAEASVRLERGHADAGWTLPEGVMLGTHRLELIDAQGASLGATSVTVAEFRQPRFRVDLAPPEGDVHAGDALSIAASARYLFGAPLEGATMRWSIAREGAAPVPSRWSEFAFGPASGGARGGTLAEGEATLDRAGAARLEAQASLASPVRTRLRVEAEVTDATGQTTSASRTVVVYPASYELGVRRPRSWVGLGTELVADVIAIDHRGDAIAGRAIEARFVREGWHGWWEWHDRGAEEGSYQLRRGQRRDVAHACTLTSASEPARCAFTPARAGTYLLEVEGRDEAGRTTLAQTRVYVAGPDEHPDRDPPGAPIALTPSRDEWTVGEEAELAFESPWAEAEALITVHHGSLLSMERRRVGAGGQVVRVPLTDAMVPNVFVTVALIRPRAGEPGERVDLNAPDLRFGSASVRVRPRTSRLEVAIEAEGAARPGARVPVVVRVRDEEGRPVRGARVALWAVDEGTLRLTGYATPDATRGLFVERGAAFALEDLRRALVSRIEPTIEAEAGGDGGFAEGAMDLEERERFDPTPLWAPRLSTGEDGSARAELTLPERPTEYRVMAIAVDEGLRRGRAATAVVAAQPLVVRGAFPRFATEGDRFEAVAFVHNAGEAAVEAQVRFHVGEAAREARVVTIPAGGEARVSEEITAREVGVLALRVEASAHVDGEAVTHADQARVPVVPAARWVRRRMLVGGSGERALDLVFDGSPRGELRVAVAAHPFVGLDGALDALDESGWGGAEAEASRLLAIASYLRLSEGLRREGRDEADLRARAARALDRLLRLRTADGGFARWRADDGAEPHETVLALRALSEASAAGLPVPEGVREAGLRRIERMVAQGVFGETYGRAGQESWALALRLLSEAGTRGGPVDALYEQREFASPAALAWLALALPEADRRRDTALALAVHRIFPELAIEGLTTGSTAPGGSSGPRAAYVERDERAIAAVLEAASRIDGGARWLRSLATELLRVQGASYDGLGAPSDVAASMAALSACALRFGREGEPLDATLAIDGAAIAPHARGGEGALFDVPWARVGRGPHQLVVRGGDASDSVFVALDARWAVPVGEADAVARGRVVALHRVLETAAGTPIPDGARVPLGTMVRVRLFVHVERGAGERIAVRDPLGAGFESVDGGLRTSPHASLMALLGASPDDDARDPRGFHAMRTLSYVEHRSFDVHATTFYLSSLPPGLHELTYAVRATTPGEFALLPATLEALRDDTFVARSSAVRVIVE